MPVTYNRVILAFPTGVDATAAVDALKIGLQVTCSQLPYLKGRVTEQQDGRLAISWSEEDPVPFFQEIDHPPDMPNGYAQLKQEAFPSHRLQQSLCPVTGWVAASFPDGDAPVLATSYTRLDGGLLVSLCVHHSVMDGTGTGQLIRLWENNAKGTSAKPLPDGAEPCHRLDLLKAALSPAASNEPNSDHVFESLLALHPEYTTVLPTPRSPKPPCTSKVFTFAVEPLKTAANESSTSMNNVLCAIIWSCISTVRTLRWREESRGSGDEVLPTESKLGMAVNGRARIGESFAGTGGCPYMGNVNLYSVTSLDLTTLTALGLSTSTEAHSTFSNILAPAVQAISASIARIDRQFISEVVSLAELAPNIKALLPGWDFFSGPDLSITSWAKLDTYSV